MISAIIPARNEEENIAVSVRSLACQPEVGEIIVVDDQSADLTGEILSDLTASEPKLKIIESDCLPDGWIGKNHAAWLGAQCARFPWLLFTDADTVHYPTSARHALEDAAAHGAALVSYSPEQIMHSTAERALIPFVYCRLATKFDFARVNDPGLPDAAANGQFILVSRDAYNAVGGHGSVANDVLEDVALARRIKRAGYRLNFAPGPGIARTRMYRGFSAMWQGWTKNLYLLLGGTVYDSAKELFRVIPWYLLMFLIGGTLTSGRPRLALFVLALVALMFYLLDYAIQLRRNRYPRWHIVYYVLSIALYVSAVFASARKHRRGSVTWKGREYPVGTLR